MKNWNSHWL